jgi:glycyl-tRNA synthetase
MEDLFKKLISHSKEYGFIFQSSEIYDGLSAVYDYGQNGSALKNNIREYWWKAMTQLNEEVVGIDAAIFMHPTVWKASGHVDAFNDPLIDNKDSKKRYRADVLIEDHLEKINQKIIKEVAKAQKRFGESFNEQQYRDTNERVLGYQRKIEEVTARMVNDLEGGDLADLKKLIEEEGIVCPISGSRNWTDVRQFNLMFDTKLGSLAEGSNTIYLRPETAQGIFVNYLNVQKTGRMKLPFGIAQTGKAFRNEIVARQFIFRMREFEQMEMQYFVKPGTEIEWFESWRERRMNWHKSFGFNMTKFRWHKHDKLAHYANAAYDIEFEFPFGFKELEGVHSRTDFDLKQHQEYSGKKLQFFDPETNESFVPYVVETSIGLDRTFLMILAASYCEEQVDGEQRVVLRIPAPLAPIKATIMPLVKKDGLPEIARKIIDELKFDVTCQYDEKDSIGKRYRRQDAIGTPFCITVDHQTVTDNTVTIRYRDTMEQERIAIDKVSEIIRAKTNMQILLKQL